MSATYTSEEVEQSFKKKKRIKLIKLEDLDAKHYEALFAGKSYEERANLLIWIIRQLGDPFETLGNNLDSLRVFEFPDEYLEIIAINLIFSKVYTNQEEINEWKQHLNAYQNFLMTPYAKKRPKLCQDIHSEILNLEGRFCLDFVTETIGMIMDILPLESETDKAIVVSELLNELNIVKPLGLKSTPYYTLKEAEDDYSKGIIAQPGRKTIAKRIKKDNAKYKEMIENTIKLLCNS